MVEGLVRFEGSRGSGFNVWHLGLRFYGFSGFWLQI